MADDDCLSLRLAIKKKPAERVKKALHFRLKMDPMMPANTSCFKLRSASAVVKKLYLLNQQTGHCPKKPDWEESDTWR